MWANYIDLAPFVPSQWSINPKVTKELAENPFGGDILTYKDWHDMVRDHLLSANQGYGRLIYELEREKVPLSMARLQTYPTVKNMTVDLPWVTRTLWTFLLRNMTKSFRKTVNSLVDGE